MPQFAYKALAGPGEHRTGRVRAESVHAAGRVLARQGIYPVDIVEDQERQSLWSRLRRISIREQAVLLRDLNDLLEAGLTLRDALVVLEEQSTRPAVQHLLRDVIESVAAGATLSTALAEHPAVFTELIVNTVRAGEAGGVLTSVLPDLAEFLEKEAEAREQVRSRLTYPALVLGAATLTVYVLLVFAIPRVADLFADMGQALPWPTRVMLAVGNWMHSYWIVMALGALTTVALFWIARRQSWGVARLHRTMLRAPLIGELVRLREISRFARALATAIDNGVPVVSAVSLSAEVIQNSILRDEFLELNDQVRRGISLGAAMRSSHLVPALVGKVVAVGERSADLSRALKRLADTYERDLARRSRGLATILEPAVILLLGLVVAFIVFAMMLPVFSMDALLT